MRVDLLDREYPPHLRRRMSPNSQQCSGPTPTCACAPSTGHEQGVTTGYAARLAGEWAILLSRMFWPTTCPMARDCVGADLVHSSTWYANAASLRRSTGCLTY